MSDIWGVIATRIFIVLVINGTVGLLYGNHGQVVVQLIRVITTIIYAFVLTS